MGTSLSKTTTFKKILIANRGEIALRIVRACKEMGIKTVVPFSDVDRFSLAVTCAEESYPLNGNDAKDTYLNIEKLIQIAKDSGAEAVHPGYGFLSENYLFAKACQDNGVVFIGPTPDVIKSMGDKISAKMTVKKARIPVVRGINRAIHSLDRAKRLAKIIGYPVIIKAVNGGGGKGMRAVTDERLLSRALQSASREANSSFNSDQVYIEKFIDNPRHIEVQILADNYGNMIHLYERDCTIQRRHQKLLEEAPCPVLRPKQREHLGQLAIKACKAMNYKNAGTVEFLMDSQGQFYFMEINARIQVEHTVTEMITGVDLIKEQIKIAAGEKLRYRQSDITISGHAIECRINAEDTEADFLPSTGVIDDIILPGGNGVRVDTALKNNYEVNTYYDSMLAKIIVHAKDRPGAINKMSSALGEMKISGVKTTISFFRKILMDPLFLASRYTTKFLETFRIDDTKDGVHFDAAAILAALYYKRSKSAKGYSASLNAANKKDNKWAQAGRSDSIRISRGW
ncbi:MAG: acetyl-CoA carboxylase biotin carboxylase subunit [Pseudomonadota bacterium]